MLKRTLTILAAQALVLSPFIVLFAYVATQTGWRPVLIGLALGCGLAAATVLGIHLVLKGFDS